MSTGDRYRQIDAARTRAELSIQDLWLQYIALGGINDAFDLDGYLQGLMPLDPFQQVVLAQTVNEALHDSYDCYEVPLAAPTTTNGSDERLYTMIRELLEEPSPERGNGHSSWDEFST